MQFLKTSANMLFNALLLLFVLYPLHGLRLAVDGLRRTR